MKLRYMRANSNVQERRDMIANVTKKILPLIAALVLASACSTKSNADDPLEGYNRGMFRVNEALDTVLIRPVAKGYRYITPQPIRNRISNVSDNLYEPISMVNNFLQGDFTGGMNNFWRFLINSSVGLGGMHDVAATAGIAPRREDFGQTLAVWGVGTGPYIVLPIFGPSNLRDTSGKVADWFMDPVNYALRAPDDTDWDWTLIGVRAGQALSQRERFLDPIDDIYSSSLDPYASFKSIYEQRRDADIHNLHSDKPKF
jgi:phospholipid-binding lipoprotein MlaA